MAARGIVYILPFSSSYMKGTRLSRSLSGIISFAKLTVFAFMDYQAVSVNSDSTNEVMFSRRKNWRQPIKILIP